MIEIERRWLIPVANIPSLVDATPYDIVQGYICSALDGGSITMRIRRRNGKAGLTIKQGTGLSRAEHKVKITDAEYDALSTLVYGWVEKTRWKIPLGDVLVELDIFNGRHVGLVIAEVEFPHETVARQWEPLPWFGAEVTDELQYTNAALAAA